ncbi:MAG: Hypoxanthine phosphoribosyltransferase [Planctomycetes bacterium]|nr:Hypoxanthine phosphoribosyltransferase [Planctomycetota bacterium]
MSDGASSIERMLLSREVIEERVKELAGEVIGAVRDNPFVVCVTLRGAFMFAADLVRHLPQEMEIAFVRAASYGGGTSPQHEPVIEIPDDVEFEGRQVLLVEDIVDTGRTVSALRNALLARGASRIRICTFLDKPVRRQVPVEPEFIGFALQGDPFVVGYGLDHGGRFRNLPYVAVLKV